MNERMRCAVRFGCRNYFKGAGVFLGAMVLISLFFGVLVPNLGGSGTSFFSGGGIMSAFFLFVLGIAGLRENLRMFLQNGVSRRTSFLAELTVLAVTAAALALLGEVLMSLLQVISRGSDRFFSADLYQLLYMQFDVKAVLSPGQHVISGLFNFCLFLAVGLFGEFFSALFWRLNKFWTIVVGVSIPVLCNAVPWGLYWLADRTPAVMEFFAAIAWFLGRSPWNVMALSLLCAAALAGINWLLLRRTQIKAAK